MVTFLSFDPETIKTENSSQAAQNLQENYKEILKALFIYNPIFFIKFNKKHPKKFIEREKRRVGDFFGMHAGNFGCFFANVKLGRRQNFFWPGKCSN